MSIERAARQTLKAEQSEKTRSLLIRVARKMFAENGYADTSLERIAEQAGVTTGAVYHQYRDKRGLFRAVLEQLQAEAFAEIRERSRERVDPRSWDRLVKAVELTLDSFADPFYCRIVMIDGPAVLGWNTWHLIRTTNVLSHMKEALEHQMELGNIAREPSEPLAHVMFGALTEVGLIIAHSDNKRSARKLMGAAALRHFNRLRVRD